VTFFGLVVRNLWARPVRSIGLTLAVAFAVMTVVTLAVTSSGLEQSATAIITIGKANITVVQKGASDILASTIDKGELDTIQSTPGVASAVGVLVEIQHINAANPAFIEIGLNPTDMAAFGVTVVAGRAYGATAAHEVMLGWRAASNLGLHVGSTFRANGTWNVVTGLYSTGNTFGDAGAMFPLPAIQGYNRVAGIVTLVFVRDVAGEKASMVAGRIEYRLPELTTISTASQFGRADRTLVYLHAAVDGSTVLAVLIGAVIVGNTMLLSLSERTREFGLLRAVGWSRPRMVALLANESLLLAVTGTGVGVALSFLVTSVLTHVSVLEGLLRPNFTVGAFVRALVTALAMTVVGALYPTIRAAVLSPLKAIQYE
jgi:putative ABC transport system permease protein